MIAENEVCKVLFFKSGFCSVKRSIPQIQKADENQPLAGRRIL